MGTVFCNVYTYHIQTDNLAVRLLYFAQLHKEVPEAGFGDDIVGRENTHAVELRRWVGLRG